MKKLLVLVFLVGCGKTQTQSVNPTAPVELPGITRLGALFPNNPTGTGGSFAETTPITFNNQVIDLAYNHMPVEISMFNLTGTTQYPSLNTNGYACGSAMTYNNTVYSLQSFYPDLTGATPYGNSVTVTSTTDLINWTVPQTILQADSTFTYGNTTMTWDGRQFVLAHDTRETYDVTWGIKTMTSPDMIHWTSIGSKFQENGYASTPTMRYLNGKYYMFYTAPVYDVAKTQCVVRVARSTDLVNWEMQNKNQAVIVPIAQEGLCASDMDLTELNGVTYMVYAYGDQGNGPNEGGIDSATYQGTLQQFAEHFFSN